MQDKAFSMQTRNIRIYASLGRGVSTRLEPREIWVEPGTVVVFNNWGKTEVKFSFDDGQRCLEGTEAAVGFEKQDQCFVNAIWIPYGGTTSLKFNKPGNYKYTVFFKGLNKQEKGGILVRTPE
jgi:hypothetical protein